MSKDRRQQERVFDVPAGLVAEHGVWAVNLSDTGMALCSQTPHESDTTLELTLELPSGRQKASARVIWCQRARSIADHGYILGIEFAPLPRATRKAIKAYLAECSEQGAHLESSFGRSA